MGAAEVIPFEEVRASKHWDALRPICIKLSRLVHHHRLPLCTTLAGRPPSCEQLLTGFSLPFLFAQQHRHVTAEVTPQGLYRAILDGMCKAVFALQPQNEFMETQFSP